MHRELHQNIIVKWNATTGTSMTSDETRADGAGAHSDYSAFVRLLETKGRVRVLDVLLGKPHSELTAKQIADLAGIDKSTVHRNKGILLEFGVIEEIDQGSSPRYTIDLDNEIAKILGRAHTELEKFSPEFVDRTTINAHEHIGRIITAEVASEAEEETESPVSDEEFMEMYRAS